MRLDISVPADVYAITRSEAAERGMTQSAVIAAALARAYGLPMPPIRAVQSALDASQTHSHIPAGSNI
jgi:predicted amidophosphoribosyltransferase